MAMTRSEILRDYTNEQLKNHINNDRSNFKSVVQVLPTSPMRQCTKSGVYTRDYLIVYVW